MRTRPTPSKTSSKPPTRPIGQPPREPVPDEPDVRQQARTELFAGPYEDADKYRLVDVRSQGGEGELWRGILRLESVELLVAVKVIHPSNAVKFEEWRERWHRQAELLRTCDHPGLVRVRDVFEGPVPHAEGERTGDRSLYLVMNWVEGPTVEQWVEMAPDRTTEAVLELTQHVAAAVDHLHSGAVAGVSVIHRDIKPANIVMGPNGPCLVDFGFARLQTEDRMTLVGTPTYLAPEIAIGGRYSPASDRFAFGGTVYFALTGKRPDIDAPEAMAARLGAVAGFRENDEAVDLVLRMLAVNPVDRPNSCAGWLQDLRSALGARRHPGARIYPTPVAAAPPAPTASEAG